MAASMALAWLILRLVVGAILAAHGAQKLFGWFEGPGMSKWEQGMRAQRFRPALFWAGLNIVGELGGGLSLAFGFLTPLGAAGAFRGDVHGYRNRTGRTVSLTGKRGIEFPTGSADDWGRHWSGRARLNLTGQSLWHHPSEPALVSYPGDCRIAGRCGWPHHQPPNAILRGAAARIGVAGFSTLLTDRLSLANM